MEYPNIILINLDCVRADKMTKENMSFLRSLADKGLYFRNAYSTASWTTPAITSLFTGLYPSEHGANAKSKYLSKSLKTLPQVLSERGYMTIGIAPNPWISNHFGFDRGFDKLIGLEASFPFKDNSYLPIGLDSKNITKIVKWLFSDASPKRIFIRLINIFYKKISSGYGSGVKINKYLEKLLDAQNKPLFIFINYMDSHDPYKNDKKNGISKNWNLRSLALNTGKINSQGIIKDYENSLQYLDAQIKNLFKILEVKGLMENTFVAIFSDHGQSLGENGFWGHGTFLTPELIRIPLIIVPPSGYGVSFGNKDSNVNLIDIFETVVQLTNSNYNSRWGYNLLSEKLPSRILLAESFGPPQEKIPEAAEFSKKGYKAVIGEKGLIIHDLGKGDYIPVPENLDTGYIESLKKAENRLLNQLSSRFQEQERITRAISKLRGTSKK